MEGQIPEKVKGERSHALIQIGKVHQRNYMERFLGREVEILFEETMEKKRKTYWTGYTREYMKTAVKSGETLENVIRTGTVTGFLQDDILICTI